MNQAWKDLKTTEDRKLQEKSQEVRDKKYQAEMEIRKRQREEEWKQVMQSSKRNKFFQGFHFFCSSRRNEKKGYWEGRMDDPITEIEKTFGETSQSNIFFEEKLCRCFSRRCFGLDDGAKLAAMVKTFISESFLLKSGFNDR